MGKWSLQSACGSCMMFSSWEWGLYIWCALDCMITIVPGELIFVWIPRPACAIEAHVFPWMDVGYDIVIRTLYTANATLRPKCLALKTLRRSVSMTSTSPGSYSGSALAKHLSSPSMTSGPYFFHESDGEDSRALCEVSALLMFVCDGLWCIAG